MATSILCAGFVGCRRCEPPTEVAPERDVPDPTPDAARSEPERPARSREPVVRRAIPKTDEALPAIGLGTWQAFDIGHDADERAQRREVLRRFFVHGGTLIDSSPMYGRAEAVVGDLVGELGRLDESFMATKVWTKGADDGIEQMKTSMKRMRAEPMDLMQVHNLVDAQTHLRTLADYKADGRVRYVGVTHWRVEAFDDLAEMMRRPDLDFVQLPYSVAMRDAEKELLPLARDRQIGVIVNRPFEGGDLFGPMKSVALPGWAAEVGCSTWAQLFLKFILSEPAVTCVIPATSDPEHLDDNMAAGHPPFLDTRQRDALASLVAEHL